jgi:hypothetical protein
MELKWWLAPTLALAMTGCIELESDDDDDTVGSSATETVAGKAADGYLYGATACLDINENKVCDPTEPSASTGPNGDFSISASPSDAAHPIVVEIVVGTIDQDDPDNPIDTAYTITAPAGYDFVSPLTTMVQNEIESSGVSADDAESAIKSLLGTSLPLNQDYVAGSTATDDFGEAFAEEFEKLHKVAQVAAAIIQENTGAVEAGNVEVDTAAAFELIVAKVADAVEDIVDEVEQAIEDGGVFDPSAIANDETIAAVTEIDVETILEEIEIAEDLNEATAANMGEILATGIYFLEEDVYHDPQTMQARLFFEYGFVDFDGVDQNFEFYYFNGTEFVAGDDSGDGGNDNGGNGEFDDEEDDFLILSASGFNASEVEDTDGPNFTSVNSDGSVVMDFGIFQADLSADEVDISGKKISTTLANTGNWLWGDAVGDTATFPANSTAYRLKQAISQDVYGMPYELVDENSEYGCDEDDAFGTTTPSCNSVRYIDGSNDVFGDAAPDTVDLVVSSAAASADVMKAMVIYTEDNDETAGQEDFPSSLVLAEFLSNGTLRFVDANLGSGALTLLESSTYTTETVHGKTLLVFEVPHGVPNLFNGGDDDSSEGGQGDGGNGEGSGSSEGGDNDDGGGPEASKLFLVEHDGFWRFGIMFEGGTVLPDDAPFVMNEIALNAAVAAFDPTNIELGDGDVDIIEDENQIPDEHEEMLGDVFVPCRVGDSGWDEETDMPAVPKGFDDFEATVDDCRLDDSTLVSGDGGFTEAMVLNKAFQIEHDETLAFSDNGLVVITETEPGEEDNVEDLTWSIDENNYLVIEETGEENAVAVFALIASDSTGTTELLVKAFFKDTAEDDGFSEDLTLDNDDDGEVFGMVWVEVPQ